MREYGPDREVFIEDTWKCNQCDSVNEGLKTSCVTCGSAKEVREADVMDVTAPIITDPEKLKLASCGENWVCRFCEGQQHNVGSSCSNCGASRESNSVLSDMQSLYETRTSVDSKPAGGNENLLTGTYIAPAERWVTGITDRFRITSLLYAVGIIAFCVLMVWLLMPTQRDVKVQSIAWQHTVTLEQRNTLHRNRDFGSPDAGAFNVSCEMKIHHYEDCNPYRCEPYQYRWQEKCNPRQVKVGSHYEKIASKCNPRTSTERYGCESQKNGTSKCKERTVTDWDTCYSNGRLIDDYETRYDMCDRTETRWRTCYQKCPVKKDYCEWDYHRWDVRDSKTLSGNEHNEDWPQLSADGTDTQRIKKDSRYDVNFTDEEGQYGYRAGNIIEFKTYNVSDAWIIETTRAGTVKPMGRK